MTRLIAAPLMFAMVLSCQTLWAADVLVVCPDSFRGALRPWIEHRSRQGHTVEVLSNQGTALEIRQAIRDRASRGAAKFLLLVGDAAPGSEREAELRWRTIPTHWVDAKVNIRWGSEPQIATDNWYADLDDDHLPELAVGRLTADSPAELSLMVRKILRYELAGDFGRWRQRINFIAGLGGFGALADATIEACAKQFITDGVPAPYSTSMTYASWRSPYCPDPRDFGRTTLARLNEGCLFWVYLGHGHAHGLDRLATPGGLFPILESSDVRQLRCAEGSPIALFLSCHAGAFDAPQDCLAEEMLRTDGAPVAVVAGSRVTMPYAMSVLGTEALKECFRNRRATLGEVLLHAKRNSVLSPRDDRQSKLLDALASALNSGGDLAAERLEHVHLFNLLGDPMLRLPHAETLRVNAAASARPGQTLEISGSTPVDGACSVELVVRRDRLAFRPTPRRQFDRTLATLASYGEEYRRANDSRLANVETQASAGVFRARLVVPEHAAGECHVRVFVEGREACAMGAADIRIAKAPQEQAAGK